MGGRFGGRRRDILLFNPKLIFRCLSSLRQSGGRDLLATDFACSEQFVTVENNSTDLKKLSQRRDGFKGVKRIAAARTDLRHEIVND
jgi:hypothetical protein